MFKRHIVSNSQQNVTKDGLKMTMVPLHLNGCWRKVVVSDIVPFSEELSPMFVTTPLSPCLEWPVFLEKSYLSLFGSNEFRGSNQASDLYTIAGWIPEFRILAGDCDSIWENIYNDWKSGNIVLGAGTGRTTIESEDPHTGLASDHSYAILGLIECEGKRMVLFRNPWKDGGVWKGEQEEFPQTDSYHEIFAGVSSDLKKTCFCIQWHTVCLHFKTLFLNWNPEMFSYSLHRHFKIPDSCVSKRGLRSVLLGDQIQLSLENTENLDITVFVLLEVHSAVIGIEELKCKIYALDADGQRIYSANNLIDHNEYTKGLRTLKKLSLKAFQKKTIIPIVIQEHPSVVPISLHFYSTHNFELKEAPHTMNHLHMVEYEQNSKFSVEEDGGYENNPSWVFSSQKRISFLTISAECDDDDMYIHIGIIQKQGRNAGISSRDLIKHSDKYKPGYTSVSVESLEPKVEYLIVLSILDKVAKEKVRLSIRSSEHLDVERVLNRHAVS